MASAGDEVTERDNTAYKPRYADWAGFPQGHKPDYDLCCAEVYDDLTRRFNQCQKKRGRGPGAAYCAVHDPDAVKARQAMASAKYKAEVDKRRYEWHGRDFYNALEQIANGHNDARGLAQEVIDKFKAGAR